MTLDESREAILAQWQRLPAWKRRTTQDASEFAHIMLASRPDLTDFESPVDHYLMLRGWLTAEQRASQPAPGSKPSKRYVAAKAKRQLARVALAVAVPTEVPAVVAV